MVQSTKALVIHTFPYSDSSIILRAYTEKFGYSSFILKGFKRNRKQKINLHPLALVEISCIVRNNSGLKAVRSIELQHPFTTLLMDPVKSGIAMFLSEWLSFTIKEDEEGDPRFFAWISKAVEVLDESDSIANYHLWFLLKLSDYMGFAPQGQRDLKTPFFNLGEGSFLSSGSSNENTSEKESILLDQILNKNLTEIALISLNKIERLSLLNLLHQYFQIHLQKEFTLKSLDVLIQLYDD